MAIKTDYRVKQCKRMRIQCQRTYCTTSLDETECWRRYTKNNALPPIVIFNNEREKEIVSTQHCQKQLQHERMYSKSIRYGTPELSTHPGIDGVRISGYSTQQNHENLESMQSDRTQRYSTHRNRASSRSTWSTTSLKWRICIKLDGMSMPTETN